MNSKRGIKREATTGLASFIGFLTCAYIASELLEDIQTRRSDYFDIPLALKVAGLLVFTTFTILEAAKWRRKLNIILLSS